MSQFPHPEETVRVANRLSELCNTGKHHEAMLELYADDARHVDAFEMPGSPFKRIMEGKPLLLQMSEMWANMNEIHDSSCGKPLINGDQFICEMMIDITAREGPMQGRRLKMSEQCLYTVKNGKIAEAKFFYAS